MYCKARIASLICTQKETNRLIYKPESPETHGCLMDTIKIKGGGQIAGERALTIN